jgi:hypothetical protein
MSWATKKQLEQELLKEKQEFEYNMKQANGNPLYALALMIKHELDNVDMEGIC